MMKNSIKVILCSTLTCQASVIWQPAPNALASASWDEWSYAPQLGQTGAGRQGAAQETAGSLITASDLETTVIDSYEFPGGLGANPDTYYFHTGGGTWTGLLELSEAVTHVRVSYSLLDFGGSPADEYPLVPGIAGATLVGEGSYPTSDGLLLGTVFFKDLALAAPQSSFETTFGDLVFPGYPGSFRSVDGVQLEVFNAAPIPEPSGLFLVMMSAGMVWQRRK